MRAVQYAAIGEPPRVVEVPDPEPGPGQVVLQVAAAGLCHSDVFIMSRTAEQYRFGPLPLTLGHEGVGTVVALGAGTGGVAVGEQVAVYGPWGCGRCRNCATGKENYCLAPGPTTGPPGIARPGALAEYLLVDDPRHLVPLSGLDPVATVGLTDAGLTPYHAIVGSLGRLGAGRTALVIGVGGLGHVAIQLLRALSAATVVACDVSPGKLEHAREVGAHHTVLAGPGAPAAIREITDGLGTDVVLDLVGSQATVELAGTVAGTEGEIVVVGIGGGALSVGAGLLAHDVSVRAPYWGSRSELIEVFELARRDQVRVDVERYALDDAPRAYERLVRGEVRGRAVVVPTDEGA